MVAGIDSSGRDKIVFVALRVKLESRDVELRKLLRRTTCDRSSKFDLFIGRIISLRLMTNKFHYLSGWQHQDVNLKKT
jgi:hypothetical protein